MDLGTFSSPRKRKREATLSRHLHSHRDDGFLQKAYSHRLKSEF